MDGFGVAYAQSLPAGTIIDPNKEITISFREINHVEAVETPSETAAETSDESQTN